MGTPSGQQIKSPRSYTAFHLKKKIITKYAKHLAKNEPSTKYLDRFLQMFTIGITIGT